jgi:hypothetical protein
VEALDAREVARRDSGFVHHEAPQVPLAHA